MTFAEKVIQFNQSLHLSHQLPPGIRVMNPFQEYPESLKASCTFYRKYYNDHNNRKIILGINPGRLGAGVTGIPFTDTKRLEFDCQIKMTGNIVTHEPSSVFVYEMIKSYGGTHTFFNNFYINSVCPLGFVKENKSGKEVNFNYYDSKELTLAVTSFIKKSLELQLAFGIQTDVAFCLGNNKNFHFLQQLNNESAYFKKIIPLEHPRYIMQYKSKEKYFFLTKYITALNT